MEIFKKAKKLPSERGKLCVTIKRNQLVKIGDSIFIKFVEFDRGQIRLVISAPLEFRIERMPFEKPDTKNQP